ncbi:hypothetical protein BDZ85DRAFT_315513 [Elsinoe ampelina]|uniref:Uncharacterized protein n=1 Tax=Elsinoe ampelina TaxID=302913 RepID=A0A6A6GQQ6_9PEZI|nr:hypothetical protein BDZ85DRAFT_315513 [Elsinoe ampelina]
MCQACYPTAILPPPQPIKSVRFTPTNAYEAYSCYPTANPESYSCYPSNQLQLIPPPPIVIRKPTGPKPLEAPAPPAAPKETKPAGPPPAKKAKISAPPSLKAGATFIYPRNNTYVHLIRETKVWEDGDGKKDWGFKIHRVPVVLSVVEFGEAVLGEEEKVGEWEVTEVEELGDGEWSKGTNIKLGDDKAKGTMGSFGWNERRGKELGPVWLVLHKG